MPRKSSSPKSGAARIPRLGAHMSVAGGVDRAIDRARSVGCTALQIFLKNNNQWSGPPVADAVRERWLREIAVGDLGVPIAHASYLINLASADEELLRKSLDNLADDVARADSLGVSGIVLHPGAHMGRGEEVGISAIADGLDRLFERTSGAKAAILLENTAGQGTALGWRFEHLRDILAGVEARVGTSARARLGVCLDTCHLLASGYDVRDAASVKATLDEFDRVVGLGLVKAVHLNDSKKGLGSRVDRHEHIGRGEIGEAGFAAWLADGRLADAPHVLETPKGDDCAEDRENLATLRRLAGA